MNRICISLAAFGGQSYHDAMALASGGVSEPLIGPLSLDHTQLCPQNSGQLTPEIAVNLAEQYPETRFRCHANVKVLPRRQIIDLSQFDATNPFWIALAKVSQALNAPAYSAHAGQREFASLDRVLGHTRRAADLFGCPVAIEGHYPTPKGEGFFLVDSWQEYRQVFDSGVPYALDLSHLNIVAVRTGRIERNLVAEMLAAPQCLEVHVSGNDGSRDQHRTLSQAPWWWDLLEEVHGDAVIFSEGKQSHPQ